jgi:hypothetical protein
MTIKKDKLIALTFCVVFSIFLVVGATLFTFERYLTVESIQFKSEIAPLFNPKVKNYYTKNCEIKNLIEKIDPKIEKTEIQNSPVTKITLTYLKIIRKKYYVTCVDPRVAPMNISNPTGKRKEFNLMDTIVLAGNTNEEYSGTIVLYDDLGTPIWWMATNSKPIANEGYFDLRDPKIIDGGTKVLFAANRTLNANFLNDAEYLIYDLVSHKVIKRYTGAKFANARGTLDFHDLQILPNSGAVGIRYPKRNDLDLTKIGIPIGTTVLDSEIVIMNPDGTEKNKFSLLDRINVDEIAKNQPLYYKPNINPVLDVVHVNSIDTVGDSVIVSARHLDAIYKIRLMDGEIIWKLGGHGKTKNDILVSNEYGVTNEPKGTIATNQLLSGQHDARIISTGELSVLDNGTTANRTPRVLTLLINEKKKIAKITNVITGSSQSISTCCGSARKLKDGSWTVNWGGKADSERKKIMNSVSSTILENGIETRILIRPENVFAYRVIPYELNDNLVELFRKDLIGRNR